jgi:hypothetical protein
VLRMSRNTRLQDSLDKLNRSLESLNMAIHRQHFGTNKMEQSVKEYFEVKNYLEMQKMKNEGRTKKSKN